MAAPSSGLNASTTLAIALASVAASTARSWLPFSITLPPIR
jgi:hypothetical protein